MARKKTGPVVRRRIGCAGRGACAPLWLQECTEGTPRAMLCGRGYLAVENCGQVTAFDEERICMQTAIGRMTVLGCGLRLSREKEDTAVVRGEIICIRIGDA